MVEEKATRDKKIMLVKIVGCGWTENQSDMKKDVDKVNRMCRIVSS